MDRSVEILRTGDFWIDLGISQVWQYLISRGSTIKVDQEENKTTVEILNEENNLVMIATQTSPKISIEYSEDSILKQELIDILEATKPDYLGISKKGNEKWDRQGLFFSAITVRKAFFEPPSLRNKRSAGRCAFCDSEKFALKETGATNQPLMANPGKFSSFYSNLRGDVKICEICIYLNDDVIISTYQHGDRVFTHEAVIHSGSNEVTLQYPSGLIVRVNSVYV